MAKKYEYKEINTRELRIDDLYQRELKPQKVQKILGEFREELVNPVKVSFRDGAYWVFDGQTTAEVLKQKKARGNDCLVECKVFYGLTWLDEVDLFLAQTGRYSSPVQMADKFKAMFNKGDEDVVKMVRGAESLGIVIDFKGSKAYNKIVALTTLSRIYKNTTKEEYLRILRIIRDTWGGVPESYSTEILKGVYIFVKAYGEDFKDSNFIKRLSVISPKVIIREAKASAAPGDSKYARQILAAYNQNTRSGRLPDKL